MKKYTDLVYAIRTLYCIMFICIFNEQYNKQGFTMS